MPHVSLTVSKFNRLKNQTLNTLNLGLNYLMKGHKAKLTLDWMNRPNVTVAQINGIEVIHKDKDLNTITLQFQIFL